MSTTSVYGARAIKRERRTRAQVDQLDQQILDVLTEDNPQSVRHVFYRMTDPRLPEPVEAEAMPAGTMRRLLRDHIEALLPPRALEIAKAAEVSERNHLLTMADIAGGRA